VGRKDGSVFFITCVQGNLCRLMICRVESQQDHLGQIVSLLKDFENVGRASRAGRFPWLKLTLIRMMTPRNRPIDTKHLQNNSLLD